MPEARIRIYVGGAVRSFILVVRPLRVIGILGVTLSRLMKVNLRSRLKA